MRYCYATPPANLPPTSQGSRRQLRLRMAGPSARRTHRRVSPSWRRSRST